MPDPVLVQHVSFSNSQGNAVTVTHYPLPNIVLSGNLVLIIVNVGGGNTPTSITDDKSNVYTLGPSIDIGQKLSFYYKANVTNGPKQIDVTWSPAAPWSSIAVSEWANIATSSTTDTAGNTNSGSGTAMTAGSITTTTAGDLIISAFIQTTTSTKITSFTAGSGMSLLSADVEDMLAVQYQIQVSAGAVNPAMTQSPTNSWIGGVIAFKQASAGTQGGTTIRVQRCHHNSIKLGDGTSLALNFPCSGNLIAIESNCIPGVTITSVTDSKSNTWQQVTGSPLNSQQGGIQQIWYAAAAVTGPDMTITIVKSGTGDEAWLFHDIVNAANSPLGDTGIANGRNSGSITIIGASITPTGSANLVLIQQGVESNTVLSLSPGRLMAATDAEEVSPWPRDQNNGPALYYPPDTTTFTNTWTHDVAPGDWGDLMAEFITAPSPPLQQEGFRWRNDDGSETTATWMAAQNTNVTVSQNANVRLRFTLNTNTSDPAATQFLLEYRRFQPEPFGAWTAVPLTGDEIVMSASANIAASGEATTRQMTTPSGKTTGQYAAGRMQDDENPADSKDFALNDWSEFEWCFKVVTNNTVWNRIYQFRMTANGTPLDLYSQIPRLSIQAPVSQGSGMLVKLAQ